MRGTRLRGFVGAAFMVCMHTQAVARDIEGPAEVIDGDTLRVAGLRIRLFGVDAPELSQNCFSNGTPMACGKMAKDVLESMIGGADLTCVGRDTDTYGRIVATCRISGVDISAALVEAGWAIAFQRYSQDYLPQEARARASRAGIWQWDFQSPEDFRSNQQARRSPSAPAQATAGPSSKGQPPEGKEACFIKGNQSRRGDWIYHLPGMPYYDATRPEAWFCSEEQAQAAGYRRAIVR